MSESAREVRARLAAAGGRLVVDARGVYQDAVLGMDEFAAERDGIALFHELVERLIIRGQQAGEFAGFEPSFVQRAINGVLFETLREQGGPAGPIREARPLQAADFVVRSLLVDQARLDGIRAATLGRNIDSPDKPFATKVGPTVETVLGLSITSTSVAWVLVDGSAADGPVLDHDAFDVDAKTNTSQHAVAVRGAQAIAAATGHVVRSIGVTWTDDVEAEARQLLESLREAGYGNLIEVPLATAAHAWVQGFGDDAGSEMPVISSAEAQVARARRAAMAVATADITGQPVDEGPAEDDAGQGQAKPTSHAMLAMLTAGMVGLAVALTYQFHTDGSTGG